MLIKQTTRVFSSDRGQFEVSGCEPSIEALNKFTCGRKQLNCLRPADLNGQQIRLAFSYEPLLLDNPVETLAGAGRGISVRAGAAGCEHNCQVGPRTTDAA